ncbi:MAG: FHA domain-containing protein [Planctomycetota bacterium]|nr:FHA domain-containing protein [Planctomycetota bacterium]
MPRLFVLSGVDLGRTFDLGDGDHIGRDPACAAPMRATSISRRHARLELGPTGWAIVDEGSRNGLLHEGSRIARLELHDGAVFRLGDVELRYRQEGGVPAPAAGSRPEAGSPPGGESAPPGEAERAAPEAGELEEIELEEIVLGDGPAVAPPAPPPAPPPPPPPAPLAAPAPQAAPAPSSARERMAEELARSGAPRPAAGGVDVQAGRPPLQYHAKPASRGLLVSDFSQFPGWLRFLLVVGAVGLALGAFLVAFRATGALKGGDRATDLPPVTDEG